MYMKKLFLNFCLILVMISIGVGCNKGTKDVNEIKTGNENIKQIGSKIAEDEIYIVSENIDYHFYNISSRRGIVVDCLSSSKLDTDNIQVDIDIKTPYTVMIDEMEEEEMNEYLYAAYCGIDWEKASNLKKEDTAAYKEYLKTYENQYNELDKNEIGKIYHYQIGINFTFFDDGENESFQDITVHYKGKEFKKTIGNIIIDYSSECKTKEGSMVTECISAGDIPIYKNKNGYMDYIGTETFQTFGQVTIKNIYLFNNKDTLKKCEISVFSDKTNFNQEWSGSAIQIEKGAVLDTPITLQRESFKNKLYYQSNNYLVVEYEEKGKQYCIHTEMCFASRLNAYEMYAYYLDGVDLTGYCDLVY